MSCIIGQILNDQESDRQNSLHANLNDILPEEKSRKDRQIHRKLQQTIE